MANEYQKELFEEFGKQKGKLKRITEKIGHSQHKFYLHISPENAVLGAIIAVMCIILAFATGVERGKKLAPPAGAARRSEKVAPAKKSAPAKTPAVKKEPEAKVPAAKTPAGIYAIQIISYKQKQPAEKKKRELTDKNIDAFIIRSGEWFQVCAGSYADIGDAKAALEGFAKDYKGCFIRRKEREE